MGAKPPNPLKGKWMKALTVILSFSSDNVREWNYLLIMSNFSISFSHYILLILLFSNSFTLISPQSSLNLPYFHSLAIHHGFKHVRMRAYIHPLFCVNPLAHFSLILIIRIWFTRSFSHNLSHILLISLFVPSNLLRLSFSHPYSIWELCRKM